MGADGNDSGRLVGKPDVIHKRGRGTRLPCLAHGCASAS